MTLKEQISEDVPVFLNTSEFADVLMYNGVNISVVQDKDQLTQKQQIDGQVEGNNLIFAAVADFAAAPNVGDAVKFNDRKAQISGITENDGIYEIILLESRR